MRHFVLYDQEDDFGEITPIHTHEDLFNKVYDRCYLLGHLDDSKGTQVAPEDVDEETLLSIARQVFMHDTIQLVDSVNDMKSLASTHRYNRLVGHYALNHSLPH